MSTAFQEWLEHRCAEDENPWGVRKHEHLLEEAFEAGRKSALRPENSIVEKPRSWSLVLETA